MPNLALAQEIPGQESTQSGEPNRETIEDLITTLESETGRQELIDKLKLLIDLEEEEDTGILPSFRSLFNLGETSNELGDQYIDSLTGIGQHFGISGTAVGNILFLVISVFVAVVFVLLNKKVAKVLDNKLAPVRQALHLSEQRFSGLFKIQVFFGYVLGIALFLFAVAEVWDIDFGNGTGSILETFLQYTFTLFIICLVFSFIWELVNSLIEFGAHTQGGLENPRMRTLIPIVRNLLLCVVLVMSGLVILSEFGIDIMPLLAGAGVLGIAIGFGAQTLVKDFLTGFIIIFEDLLQVGDVVRVGDRLGLVEKITIRKIQLRDLSGTVYTVPFSEVDIVDNLTKEYSYYCMDIGVAYRENTDEVVECLKKVGQDLQQSEDYENSVLEDLEILGVDKFADSAVIIKARIKTRAHDKWRVGREFNRRMKLAFDENSIEIPFPHQTIYFGEDKDGKAPRAPIQIFKDDDKKSGKEKQGEDEKIKETDTNTEADTD